MKACCKMLKRMIVEEVLDYAYEIVWMKGVENMVNDGPGYWDDMTPEYPFAFCPFCGKQIVSDEELVKMKLENEEYHRITFE